LTKLKLSGNYLQIAIFALLASLGLNVDLSVVTSLDNFRIEGFLITRNQEVSGHLSGPMEIIATFFAGFSGNSVLWLCIFFALCMLFYRAAAVKDLRIHRYSLIAAGLFSLLYVVGFSITRYGSLIAITNSAVAFLKCVVAFVGIALVFFALFSIFFEKVKNSDFDDSRSKNIQILAAGRKAFVRRCAVIFICWLPYLIVHLPGFFPRDTAGQLAQFMGDRSLSDHHPIFMTALSGMFIRVGMLLGSANIGLLLYSLFQMLVMAAAFSYIIHCMAKQYIHIYMRGFTLIFFALYPVHALYSITMWKDTLFSVVFMLLTLKSIQMISRPDKFFASKKDVLAFGLLCVALFLTRNNGFYILLVLLPVLLIFLRRYWKRILVIIGIFAISFVSIQIINVAFSVQRGSIGEALSIPLQQISRTVKYHGHEIPDGDKALISSILEFDQLPELYDPTISDPVKAGQVFNEAAFRANSSTYISLWARLFAMYPLTYIEALLCQTCGYWYPDIDHSIVARGVWQNNYGIHYWRIVPQFVESAFTGIFVIRVFPAISMMVSIGFAVWMTIVMGFILVIKRNYKLLLVFLPVFLLWLTCIASPVSGMLRYIYGLFLVLPLLVSVALQDDRWCEKQD